MQRRNFLKSVGAVLALRAPGSIFGAVNTPRTAAFRGREYWIKTISKIAGPLLEALAEGKLKERMPVEARTPELADKRRAFTHLEGFARLLSGISPWLQNPAIDPKEEKNRARLNVLALQSLQRATDPQSPDFMNFSDGEQPLVDAAFLALGLLRGRRLWDDTPSETRRNIVSALRKTRTIKPHQNNWLLFSAMIEAFFISVEEEYKPEVIEFAISRHDAWYKGDGAFGDGPEFHWDYYNSFVMQPFLQTILAEAEKVDNKHSLFRTKFQNIALRYAAVQERMIAPEGTFPALGRSITYRCGAFHHLANQALLKQLPKEIAPAQARCALTAVIGKTLDDKKNYTSGNWLRPGLSGYQPDLAENYISTGSLYLCATAFLPLGLPQTDKFWNSPDKDWSSRAAWKGVDMPADKALKIS